MHQQTMILKNQATIYSCILVFLYHFNPVPIIYVSLMSCIPINLYSFIILSQYHCILISLYPCIFISLYPHPLNRCILISCIIVSMYPGFLMYPCFPVSINYYSYIPLSIYHALYRYISVSLSLHS